MFETAAARFRMIDGAGFTVYIPRGDGAVLINALREKGPSRALLRKLGEYAVSLYRRQFEELCSIGAVEKLSDTAGVLDGKIRPFIDAYLLSTSEGNK